MLKIKDNVDLKELEKFGFIFQKDDFFQDNFPACNSVDTYIFWYKAGFNNYNYNCKVRTDNRKLVDFNDCILDTLYDLIKADLVEKVEVVSNE